MATIPSHALRHLTLTRPWLRKIRCTTSLAFSSQDLLLTYPDDDNNNNNDTDHTKKTTNSKSQAFFPKKNQVLELECESLAFKGKGVCKVADSGFVLLCDNALPGERFIGRVSRKKGSYAEVTKLKTLSPHRDLVDAPCEYASYCGGCKTQNWSYEAQLRAKEQQVRELVIHVGKLSDKNSDFECIMKPIVPCDVQFHYRNKMEFSFGSQKWLPKELLHEKLDGNDNYALGLHAPGYFDKILNVDKCLLQSEPANKICRSLQLSKTIGKIQNYVFLHTMFTPILDFLNI